MAVSVRLSNLLRQATNWQDVVTLDAKTPADCLRLLEAQFPGVKKWIYDKNDNMWDRIQLFVNGKRIPREALTQPMKDGDELHILLNIGGG